MPVEFGQVLGMIGGSPILKAGKVVIEKLKAAKTTDPGGSGNVLQSLLQNGPGSVLQNPMQAVNGLMSGNIQNAVSALAGNSGAGSLLSALGSGNRAAALTSAMGSATNLTDATNALRSMTSSMSGLTNAASGSVGLMDMIGHSNMISGLTSVPSNISIPTITAPLNMQSTIQSMANNIPQIVSAVNAGTMPVATAAATVQGYVNQINAALSGTVNGIAQIQSLAQQISTASMISVAVNTTGIVDPAMSAQLKLLINPTGPLASQ